MPPRLSFRPHTDRGRSGRASGGPPQDRYGRIVTGALLGAAAGFFIFKLALGSLGQDSREAKTMVAAVIGGMIVAALRQTRWLEILGVGLAALYFVVAWTPLMSSITPRWVRQDSVTNRPDALFVLSSSIRSDSALDNAALDRLLTGLQLIARDSIPRLVTSQIRISFDGVVASSDASQHETIEMARTPPIRWDVVKHVHSTHDEAERAARLLLPAGDSTLVVVTSPMHTRRACATFERVGFTVVCRAAREHDHVTWHPRTAGDRLAAFRDYLYERAGMVKYRWNGWIAP